MTPEEIKVLKELCEKATPGPWEVFNGGVCEARRRKGTICLTVESTFSESGVLDKINDEPNSEFIAAAREAVPKLIAEVERGCIHDFEPDTSLTTMRCQKCGTEAPRFRHKELEAKLAEAVEVLKAVRNDASFMLVKEENRQLPSEVSKRARAVLKEWGMQ